MFTAGFGIAQLVKANDLQSEQNRLERAAMDSHLGEVMMDLDRHFVTYPQVRSYFYADRGTGIEPPRVGRLRAQVLSTAEMVIDFSDDVAAYVRERKMPESDADRWRRIVSGYWDESPALRETWARYYSAYTPDTACIVGAPTETELERRVRERHPRRLRTNRWIGGCEFG